MGMYSIRQNSFLREKKTPVAARTRARVPRRPWAAWKTTREKLSRSCGGSSTKGAFGEIFVVKHTKLGQKIL